MAPIGKKTGSGQARVRAGRGGPVLRCWRHDDAGRRCQRHAMIVGAEGRAEAAVFADCGDGRHNFTPPKHDRVGQQKQVKR